MLGFFRRFVNIEALSGGMLFLGAIAALFAANSHWQPAYDRLVKSQFLCGVNHIGFQRSCVEWVNDGLMVFFFLLVTLEIKRETVIGELNTLRKCLLPIIAAIGGMAVPALIYFLMNSHDPIGLKGWAIPTPTDTAFSLAVLTLVRRQVPLSLKVFLTAVAIFDDIGSIIVIAIYYTQKLDLLMLGMALMLLVCLLLINRFRIGHWLPYVLVGLLLWAALLNSGVHAVLAGVLLALFIPVHLPHKKAVLEKWEKTLHPFVAYFVLPIFAFVNAGIDLRGLSPLELIHPVSMGISAGLFVGKPIGVFGATWIAVKSKLCKLPIETTYRGIFGIALICGIGFTMSLFVGELSFGHGDVLYEVWLRVGVIFGSLLAATTGYLWFKWLVR